MCLGNPKPKTLIIVVIILVMTVIVYHVSKGPSGGFRVYLRAGSYMPQPGRMLLMQVGSDNLQLSNYTAVDGTLSATRFLF